MKFTKISFDSKAMGTIGMVVTVLGALCSFIGESIQSKAADDHIRELAQEVYNSQK